MQNYFGSNLRIYRTRNCITQKELGEYLSVSDKTISSWEHKRTSPDIDMLFKISHLFNVSLEELVKINANIRETFITPIKLFNYDNIHMQPIGKRILIFLDLYLLAIFINFGCSGDHMEVLLYIMTLHRIIKDYKHFKKIWITFHE